MPLSRVKDEQLSSNDENSEMVEKTENLVQRSELGGSSSSVLVFTPMHEKG
jgi:hypothetical protein